MGKFREYIDETSNELFHKVSWPTWSELQSSATVVLIASAIIAMIVFGMDWSFNKLMEIFYQIF